MPLINTAINIEDDADFVIIGSGPAGATCARWLTAAGKSVIIIEEGGAPVPAEGDALQAMTQLYRDSGTSTTLSKEPIPLLQGKALGGTSVINGAIQVRFPESVWRDWVIADNKWGKLLPWKELEEANDTVDRELDVRQTPPHLLGENGGTFLQAFGDKAHPARRNATRCKGSGRCLQGCPHHVKESVDVNYLAMAQKKGARIYTHCTAKKVMLRNARAIGVKAKFASGEKFTAYAKQAVIMAASAIQTPWLLLKSGIPLNGNGFMCHPGTAMAGLFDKKISGMAEATQSAESLYWLDENLKFESLGMPQAFKMARIPGSGKLLEYRMEKADHVALWGVACKAEARGKVIRGPFGPLVVYTPSDKDRSTLLRGLSIMAEAMLNVGAKEVWPSVYGLPEVITNISEARDIANVKPQRGLFPMVATHLFCGVTIREKFQVENIGGLVIADSSFFPSNIGVNPMSAIMSAATLVARAWI